MSTKFAAISTTVDSANVSTNGAAVATAEFTTYDSANCTTNITANFSTKFKAI